MKTFSPGIKDLGVEVMAMWGATSRGVCFRSGTTLIIRLVHENEPPTSRLDFHLVQLFFALMPSLAVYLVAQYSRYEMRRMEAEVEVKKKAEEEEKAKEMEAAAGEEKETETVDPELLKVKERLDALEETLKEIVVETKKRPSEEKRKSADKHQEKADPNSRPDNSHTAAKKQPSTEEVTSGQPHMQHDSAKKGSHGDEKK